MNQRQRLIHADEFLAGPAGQYYQKGEYEKALIEMEILTKKYPGDSLISRYYAMTLDELGRSDEAIVLFEEMIAQDPVHIPTHYFLAKAYARNGQTAAALEEWNWVIGNANGTPYEEWAKSAVLMAGGQ